MLPDSAPAPGCTEPNLKAQGRATEARYRPAYMLRAPYALSGTGYWGLTCAMLLPGNDRKHNDEVLVALVCYALATPCPVLTWVTWRPRLRAVRY
eukprot:70021-Rhodomonas_salina.8